mgnify:CR=1 FL=1
MPQSMYDLMEMQRLQEEIDAIKKEPMQQKTPYDSIFASGAEDGIMPLPDNVIYNQDGVVINEVDGQLRLNAGDKYATGNQEQIQQFMAGNSTIDQMATGTTAPIGNETAYSAGMGLLRGGRMMAETPEVVMDLAGMGKDFMFAEPIRDFRDESVLGKAYERGVQTLTSDNFTKPIIQGKMPFSNAPQQSEFQGVTPEMMNYEGANPADKYAGTISEFAAGGIAGKLKNAPRNIFVSGSAGAASEAAGQTAANYEFSKDFEPVARLLGAFASPMASLKAINTGNKTLDLLMNRAGTNPTGEKMKQATNQAYKLVSDANLNWSQVDSDAFINQAIQKIQAVDGYVPDIDLQTTAAIKILKKRKGKGLTFEELDNIRQNLFARYNKNNDEYGVRVAINEIDSLIAKKDVGNPLVDAARLASSRQKKVQALEQMMDTQELQTASTGTGGNLINKYKQGITKLLNPKNVNNKFFSPKEKNFMRKFVNGDLPDKLLRFFSRFAPTSGALTAMLGLGSLALDSVGIASLFVVGQGAKIIGESRQKVILDQIKRMMAGAADPDKIPSLADDYMRILMQSQDSVNFDEKNKQAINLPILDIGMAVR